MVARVTEVLMGPGSWSLSMDWDSALYDLCKPGSHILLYEGQRLVYGGILTDRTPGREITLHGRGLLRLLGQEGDGPHIDWRRYTSGRNLLSNGDFALPAGVTGPVGWELAEGTGWGISGGVATTAFGIVLDEDDVLAGTEQWEARAGDVLTISLDATRGGTGTGRLRARMIFEGDFAPTDILPPLNEGWSTSANDPSGLNDVSESGGVITVGPSTRRHALEGSFETGISPWAVAYGPGLGVGGWSHDQSKPYAGLSHVTTNGTTHPSGLKGLFRSGDLVWAGERYKLSAKVMGTPPPTLDGQAGAAIKLTGESGLLDYQVDTQRVRSSEINNPDEWRSVEAEIDVPTGAFAAQVPLVFLVVSDHSAEYWSFDEVRLERVRGNRAWRQSGIFGVSPGERLTLTADVASGTAVTEGECRFILRCYGFGAGGVLRPSVDVAIGAVTPTDGVTQRAEMTVYTPSGYDACQLLVMAADVVGGSFEVRNLHLRRPTDRRPVDAVADSTGTVSFIDQAPLGSRSVRVAVVAEADGGGWTVDNVSLIRAGTIWRERDVVVDLITHPQTFLLQLFPGSIGGVEADELRADWTVRRRPNRGALEDFTLGGVARPGMEWRIDANAPDHDWPGTFHWGRPEDLFADRREHLLVEGDFRVLGPVVQSQSIDDMVSHVSVVGAEYLSNGRPHTVEGSATVTGAEEYLDWQGQPINWTRIVADPTIEHEAHASALAALEAGKVLGARRSVSLELSDWSAWGPLDVGDWAYVHDAIAGLVDEEQEMVDRDGRVVHPWRTRLIERDWQLGSHWRAVLRRPTGETIELPVTWEKKTTARVVLGDRPAEFVVNPQAGDPYAQILRAQASGR